MFSHILSGVLVFPEHPLLPTHLPLPLPYNTILYLPHIPCHTIPHHTCHNIPYLPYHTILYHTIPYHTIPYRTMPHLPYHTIPHYIIPYIHTLPYHTHHTAPPGRPRQSEDTIRKPYYLSGFVPLPPLQGGPARARTLFANHIICQVSCPSHPSREAPPERGQYSRTILFIRFRAPPTPPWRPRQSEEGIREPYYFQVSCPSHPSMEAPPERGGHS